MSSIKRCPRARRQATASFTASVLPTMTSQIWLVNAAICFFVSKRISGSRSFASNEECIGRPINDRWCSKSCAAFSSTSREYKWIWIEPNHPPCSRGRRQVVAQASSDSSLLRISRQDARWPHSQDGCANGARFSGQDLTKGGQEYFHLALFADS